MKESENRSKLPNDPDELVGRLLRFAGPRAEVPPERRQRVREVVFDRWRTTVRSDRRKRTFLWLGAALSAAALLTIGIALERRLTKGGLSAARASAATLQRLEGAVDWANGEAHAPGDELPAGTRMSTGPEGRAALLLPGGACLRADRATKLRLLSGSVVELEQGALYFDSGKAGEAVPLEIRTRLGSVRHQGTQFEVRLDPGEMRVSVREGVATLTREDRSYTAPAGTRLSMNEQGVVETSPIPRQGADWEWMLAIAPAFDLEGKTLGEFLDWVSSETGWEVRYEEPSIAVETLTVILHGSVAGMRPDEAPAAVLPTCGLTPHRDGGILTVRRGGS